MKYTKQVQIILIPLVWILSLAIYLLLHLSRLSGRMAWKYKRRLFQISTMVGLVAYLSIAFTGFVSAPKFVDAKYEKYIIPQLNSNTDQKQQVITLIKKIWGKDSWIGLNIARCESGFNPEARNFNPAVPEKHIQASWDLGVMQINTVHDVPEMLNPVANISYGYTKYLTEGTGPWQSSKSCWSVVLGDK